MRILHWAAKYFLRARARRYLAVLIQPASVREFEAARALKACVNLAVESSWTPQQLASVASAVFFAEIIRDGLSDEQRLNTRNQVENNWPKGIAAELKWLAAEPRMQPRPEWDGLTYSLVLASAMQSAWLVHHNKVDHATKRFFSMVVADALVGTEPAIARERAGEILDKIRRPQLDGNGPHAAVPRVSWVRRLGSLLAILTITILGALGSAMVFSALKEPYSPGIPFFFGMLCLIPCWFIYRSVFRGRR